MLSIGREDDDKGSERIAARLELSIDNSSEVSTLSFIEIVRAAGIFEFTVCSHPEHTLVSAVTVRWLPREATARPRYHFERALCKVSGTSSTPRV